MAQVTQHLGFGVTRNITYEHPYLLARRIATLDHLTNGRLGWNIVTGFQESGAKVMGMTTIKMGMTTIKKNQDSRYDEAEEHMEVVYSFGSNAGNTARSFATKRALSSLRGPRFTRLYTTANYRIERYHQVKREYRQKLIARSFLAIRICPDRHTGASYRKYQ